MSNNAAIKKQVELLRKYYNISVYPDDVSCLCNECDLENYLFSLRNNLYYEQIFFYRLGIDNPYHRLSLIGFDNNDEIQWFLVDPTYGQFFKNKKFRDYMFSNYREFSISLLNDGFVLCNLENINSYINGFIYSGAFSKNINYKLVQENFYNLLLNVGAINKDDKFISMKLERKKARKKS